MEFNKKEIQNVNWKAKNTMQFTIDDTINIPDSHLDMEEFVLVKGNVLVDETQAMVDRFLVKGNLCYQILYCVNRENNVFDSMEGKVPFIEYINVDGTEDTDYIETHMYLNDLTVTMLHSRKLNLKALVGMDYQMKAVENIEIITGMEDIGQVKALCGNLSMMCLRLQKKERLMLNRSVQIPSNKPNIYQVIWKSLSVNGIQVKPGDGCLNVTGMICVFLIYTAQEEEMPIQYFTMEIPFEQRLENGSVNEDMVSGCVVSLQQYHMNVALDENGEDRQLDMKLELDVEMKMYGREDMEILKDAYSTNQELLPQYKNIFVQHLLIRNCAKTKLVETVTMPKNHGVLQICNVEGSVSIDDTERQPNGILVEGVVGCQVTYLNKDEKGMLASTMFDLPFSYEIEIPGTQKDVTYSIVPSVDRISAMQNGDAKLELKVEVSLEVLVFQNEMEKVVLRMDMAPIDLERKKEMSAVIGYIVKKDDTLWSIAKQYYTTVARIKEINELEKDEIEAGDRLVILKE